MDFNKFFFKIGSHGTIYTFKNYFATEFSIFNNKRYPNRHIDSPECHSHIDSPEKKKYTPPDR